MGGRARMHGVAFIELHYDLDGWNSSQPCMTLLFFKIFLLIINNFYTRNYNTIIKYDIKHNLHNTHCSREIMGQKRRFRFILRLVRISPSWGVCFCVKTLLYVFSHEGFISVCYDDLYWGMNQSMSISFLESNSFNWFLLAVIYSDIWGLFLLRIRT